MTRLFKLAAGMGLPSSRYARLGQAHTGDLQKRRYANLEEENRKLKQLVADLSLDKKMLQDVLSKKL